VSAIEKVILFGDSLMAGYGLPKEQHLSVVLQNSLELEGHNIEIINGICFRQYFCRRIKHS